MTGAIVGDVAGSRFELYNRKTKEFSLLVSRDEEERPCYFTDEIKAHTREYYYPLDFTLDEIRPGYSFDVSCQGSVPQALEAFFESTSFEDAIHNAISIGGDSDTIGAICGAVAESFYGVPEEIRAKTVTFLSQHLLDILREAESRFVS